MSDASDCFEILGLDAEQADVDDVVRARRRLAAQFHPDRGGDSSRMVQINAATDRALQHIALRTRGGSGTEQSNAPSPVRPDHASERGHSREGEHPQVVDRPSFTVDVLPVDAFEGLLLVVAELGEIVDEDPPYLLETLIRDRGDGHGTWCRLELVPDAGSTTVSLFVESDGPGGASVTEIRDAWIEGLNRLDWSSGAPAVRPPS
ncbi:MAG: J domain-containing protein [Ilumatobacteraceae bacterium]